MFWSHQQIQHAQSLGIGIGIGIGIWFNRLGTGGYKDARERILLRFKTIRLKY